MKLIFFAALSLHFVSPVFLSAQDDLKFEGINIYSYADKPDKITFIYKDQKNQRETAKETPIKEVSPAAFTYEDIRIRVPTRWSSSYKTLEFGFTEHALRYKEHFQNALLEILNKNRGTNYKPSITLTNRVDAPIAARGLEAYAGDGRNTIIMHPEDLYLDGKNTIAICQLRGFNFVNYTFEEADVFFNSRYFEWLQDTDEFISKNSYATKTIVHEFGHVYGFMHTCWDEDIMLDASKNVKRWNFEDQSSVTWRIHKTRDKLVYSPNYNTEPLLVPVEHAVVDISQASYISSVNANLMKYYLYEMIDTNLHGRSGDPMEIAIYPGWHTKSVSAFGAGDPFQGKTPILQLYSEGSEGTEADLYQKRMSYIHLDNQDNLNSLKENIDDMGAPAKIHDNQYLGALKVTLVIRGFLSLESTEKHTIFSNVYLVYSQDYYYRRQIRKER